LLLVTFISVFVVLLVAFFLIFRLLSFIVLSLRVILLWFNTQDAIFLILKPLVTDTSLVVATIVQRVGRREIDQITRAFLHAFGQILSMASEAFFREWSHFAAAKVILWMQIEKVE